MKAAGIVFLKYHDYGARDLFFAMAREARRAGLPLVGHVPTAASTEAVDSGLRSVEHMDSQRQCWSDFARPYDATQPATLRRCALLAAAYRRNGTWLVPTLSESHNLQHNLEDAQRVLRTLRRFGVTRLLAGTDVWPPSETNPQIADELARLVGAGLTPLEALQTATLNPARFLGATDSLGTVAAGKLADLVLLDADPLADIRNAARVWAVVANGRYYDRAALDALDPGRAPVVDAIAGFALPARRAPARRPVALRDVTVIDVRTGRRLARQTVLVAGNRIQAVGPAAAVPLPRAARVINARGQYLIPGLWDMHAHVSDPSYFKYVARHDSLYRGAFPRYLAHGVTGLRELGQRFYGGTDSFWVWRRAIREGRRVGPRTVGPSAEPIVVTGFNVNRPDATLQLLGMASREPDSARSARAFGTMMTYVADSLKADGTAFIVHEQHETRGLFFAVLRAARRVGLPVAGTVPADVTHVEAADSGLASIEHLDRHPCGADAPAPATADSGADSVAAATRCAAVAEAYRRNGTWLVPTLVRAQQADSSASALARAQRAVRLLRMAGMTRFLAGTGGVSVEQLERAPSFQPAAALIDEVVLLGGAGLSPLEALQTATLNPAHFLGAADSLGTVEAGKLADLVLLDADPLADLRHLRQVRAVIADGRYYNRATLDGLLVRKASAGQQKTLSGSAEPARRSRALRSPPMSPP